METLPFRSRRRTLQQFAALGAGSAIFVSPSAHAAPDLYRIPGEFEPARAIWIGYDDGHVEFTLDLVEALLPYVKIKLLSSSLESEQEAKNHFKERGIRADRLQYFIDPIAMFYLRDAAVFASGPKNSLGVVNFRWNQYGLPGWCAQRFRTNSEQFKQCNADAQPELNELDRNLAKLTRAQVFSSPLYLEGGGVEVNGRGLMIANKALLAQRNPKLSLTAMENALLDLPGVRKVIWVPAGMAEDSVLRSTIVGRYVGWGTGGHTDEFVRFADPNTVLLAWPDDAEARSHPVAKLNLQRMQASFDILSRATDADGRGLRVIKVPTPKIIERRIVLTANADTAWSEQWHAASFPARERRRDGDWVMQVATASYLNFVIANGVVVVPDYLPHGTSRATQERVRRIFEAVFVGRKIHFIDAVGLNWYGGGPHCATLTEPMGD